ncbi:hypothetical protein ASG87_13145 [Frateuria sp. Soil773]|uniref:hypothetical protein n=1 Tax=Frateuria sp. Soil773 TaxID=1736407 RepID=UPI0006F62B23|nr:hypothetical protein [Frateuria sp. Soil773]KRE99933.1 hypothetical protein ASG87_13145 [Frateuria sp. Soil773]
MSRQRYAVRFESDRYVVAQRLPLGIGSWAWSSICVAIKAEGRLVEASLRERLFLGAVMRSLSRLGMAGPDEVHEHLFEHFAASVGARGTPAWQAFFRERTPQAVARSLAGGGLLPA